MNSEILGNFVNWKTFSQKMVTEEMETLNETLDSAVQAQENGARVSVDDDKGVKDDVYVGGDGGGADEPMVVEAEISVEKSFVCSNDGGGGVIGDAKEDRSPAVEGLIDGGSTLLNGDGSCKETGLNENGGSVVEEVHGSLDSIKRKEEIVGMWITKVLWMKMRETLVRSL